MLNYEWPFDQIKTIACGVLGVLLSSFFPHRLTKKEHLLYKSTLPYSCEAYCVPLCLIPVCKWKNVLENVKFVYFYHNFVNMPGIFFNKMVKISLSVSKLTAHTRTIRFFFLSFSKSKLYVTIWGIGVSHVLQVKVSFECDWP